MSDTRTQAIQKAATELVEELLDASRGNGGERWFHIMVRKMERLPYEITPKVNPKAPLRLGTVLIEKCLAGARLCGLERPRKADGGFNGPEEDRQLAILSKEDLTKLKLWLNGE